jgi:hypothetical protein
MAARETTIRFSEDAWELLEREAGRLGVSSEELIRDAALMRVAWLAGRRGEDEAGAGFAPSPGGAPAAAGRDDEPLSAEEPPPAVTDPARLASLRATGLLDSPPEEDFDRLTRLAADLLDAPMALVTLVGADRQFLKSASGLTAEPWASSRETALSHSICQHVVERQKPLLVDDLREHPVLRDSLVIPDLGIVAYAGVPLTRPDGHVMGSLCVTDSEPRQWTSEQLRTLEDLARSVV